MLHQPSKSNEAVCLFLFFFLRSWGIKPVIGRSDDIKRETDKKKSTIGKRGWELFSVLLDLFFVLLNFLAKAQQNVFQKKKINL